MGDDGYVLIVDDDDDIRTVMGYALEAEGYSVVTAASGAAALAALANVGHPAVVLLDLMMPDMNGGELLAALRANAVWSTLPVILVSGDTAIEQRARDLHASGSLAKPIQLESLLGVLEKWGTPHAQPT